MADGLNDARALRVAELINDYRTLHIHISEQTMHMPLGDMNDEGYRVLQESHAAAQRLLASNYNPVSIQGHGDEETRKAQLRRIIIDASARRFQAHKIYLRVAAVRRWQINRSNVLRGPKSDDAARLREIDAILQSELASITDQFVVSDLRAADARAGHWLDEDPTLDVVLNWIRSQT
ncbi:hypothetical protein VTN77DRAFT_7480 [Rasamsonia byssochlamydoides]|uniref:uncharacterized protein n=1 Tax=Rasamsonia byssochlamydoides TaxID=89139 RepID=UPI0037441B4F